MAKGIIYLAVTNKSGLLKIGRVDSQGCLQNLENNGYRLEFAVEVNDYEKLEQSLHIVFKKSCETADTDLFTFDVDVVKDLFSAFEGKIVFPVQETEKEYSETRAGFVKKKKNKVSDGKYYFSSRKDAENKKKLNAEAVVVDDCWTLLKGSVLGLVEGKGCSQRVKAIRSRIPLDSNGRLLEDFSLGKSTSSEAGSVVVYGSCQGPEYWKTISGDTINSLKKENISND